jgi:hypothetical protein
VTDAPTATSDERLPAAEPLGRLTYALVAATLLAHALYAALQTSIATDVWWAMASGRYILEHGAIPRVDVFSHTYPGSPWVNGEWLSQVLFYAIYHWCGATTLALFKVALATGFYAAAAWIGWKRSGSLVGAVVVTASVIGNRTFFDIKSDLFLFVGTPALMALHDAYRRGASKALLVVLPIMFALWVNLHFSFVYGLGVLFLLTGTDVVQAWLGLPGRLPRARVRALVVAAVVAAAACLLNPYGARALTYPFAIFGEGNAWREGITEWQPTLLFQEAPHNPAFFGYYFTAQVLLAVGALIVAPRRFDLPNALHVAATAVMALGARRFVGLFALVAAPFGATNLAVVWEYASRRTALRFLGPRARAAITATACAGAVAHLLVQGVPYVRRSYAAGFFAGTVEESFFPTGPAEFLNRNPLPARLFHPYTWGGYLMFSTRREVFSDGRGHLVYPDAFYAEESIAEYGTPGWAEILDRREVSVIVWSALRTSEGVYRHVWESLSRSPQWVRVYDDARFTVFAHVARGRAWVEAFHAFALDYPDNPRVRLFIGEQYLAANRFGPAHRTMQEAMRRLTQTGPNAALDDLERAARGRQEPALWFQVAFFRDVRDEHAAARAAYEAALAGGIGEPQASWAREAVERLQRK